MKCWYMLMALLVSGLVSVGGARAEEESKGGDETDYDKEFQRLELDNKQLDLQERQSALEFKNEMRQLKLKKGKAELDQLRQMNKVPAPMNKMPGETGPGPRMQGPVGPDGKFEGPRMGPCGPGGRPEWPGLEGRGGPCGPAGCPLMSGRPGGLPSCHKRGLVVFILVTGLIHILLAMWVYQDIRKRSVGSGVWILLVLLAGFIAALVYAIVRIGDKPATA